MKYLLLAACIVFSHSAFAQNSLKVSKISCPGILIDGQIVNEEWKGASSISISDSITLHLVQDQKYLFIAMKKNTPVVQPFYTDVFIKTDTAVYALHASFQVGELSFADKAADTLRYQFGNMKKWMANEVKGKKPGISRNQPFVEQIYPYDGYEFQIDKSKLLSKNKDISIYIEIGSFIDGKIITTFPAKAERKNSQNWSRLMLK